jgi:uncharacterized zinc-type alcohol dehydrogenase-like protein
LILLFHNSCDDIADFDGKTSNLTEACVEKNVSKIRGWASLEAAKPLAYQEFDLGTLGDEEVEVDVDYCGICHTDLSMINNEWDITQYPLVPGHEVVGRVSALGQRAKGLSIGQRVGIGCAAESCMHCKPCLSGAQNFCETPVGTIMGHHGGFANKVRAHWAWTIPLPENIEPATAGPLLCGGMTVFKPFLDYNILPTARVGVVGIGGLGHMAIQFAARWGCEVTAFTSTPEKAEGVRSLGAHRVIASNDTHAIEAVAESLNLDLLLVTVNVPLDWNTMIGTLGIKGRLHFVGMLMEPFPLTPVALIMGQRQISGSGIGTPTEMATMLDFAARHNIQPRVEQFPMSKVNEALAHLQAGKARYRIVLKQDVA